MSSNPVNKDAKSFPDKDWSEVEWEKFVNQLVEEGLVSRKEIASIVLGQLNPPQVGTQLASNPEVKKNYPKRHTWQPVKKWLYAQSGKCVVCGTRIELQSDHIIPREEHGDSVLSNYQLLCRRHNVIRRPSHKKGGLTFLTAESALMWLLLFYRPKTYEEYEKICREYGLTMANIRFQEAWAMAIWLNREGKYEIDEP